MVKRYVVFDDHVEQNERAYQKQDNVFEESTAHADRRGKCRYFRKIGLGFKVPKEAINSQYVDKKCPFTGNVSIRGRILRGVVRSAKMQRTIIVRRDYMHFQKKYGRYEKRHKNVAVHCSPCHRPVVGDEVVVGECRPMSKTVRYNVLKVNSRGGDRQARAFSKH
ncbi:Ribosomal protein S17 [Perkinsela sp. CCAP 1560/4]|nr:Ribosomal protein S17 [Perkinsela sp. CCAP 1560/4]|eukprot:KNH08373.1 Ribosomal protein S17 [Perkinsela sp. CCAP 1560/4]